VESLLGRGREVCCLYSHRHARRSHVGRRSETPSAQMGRRRPGPGVIEIDTSAHAHSNRGYGRICQQRSPVDSRCNW